MAQVMRYAALAVVLACMLGMFTLAVDEEDTLVQDIKIYEQQVKTATELEILERQAAASLEIDNEFPMLFLLKREIAMRQLKI